PGVVARDGGVIRRWRGLGHGAVVRDGPPMARLDRRLRRRLRASVQPRRDLLLPGSHLHHHLYLWLAAPVALGALPPGPRAAVRRDWRSVLDHLGEWLDELPDGVRGAPGRGA